MHQQFPTQIIISFIPQSFLTGTDPYRPIVFRMVNLNPPVAFVAIDRKGDRTLVIPNYVIEGT